MKRLARRPGPWALTALLGLAYLITAPASPDLAAASYRSELFGRAGFTLWDNAWYGGHNLLAYSLFSPALGWLLGPRLLCALCAIAAVALFTRLLDGLFEPAAVRFASLLMALGSGIELLSSRVPFDLGLAVGLGALVAARRGRQASALALTLLTPLASPIAGAFLGLAYLTWGLAAGVRRRLAAAGLVCALAPIAIMSLLFPEGGTEPFAASAFYPALAATLAILALTGSEQRLLRLGCALYALALTGAYLIPTAVGGNADRLGALLGAPVAALVLLEAPRSGRRLLLVATPVLIYWQVRAPVADLADTISEPAVQQSYYRPLLAELGRLGVTGPAAATRIEVVPTAEHWDPRFVAPEVALARGWERQLDRLRNGVFYSHEPLTVARYRTWLHTQGVSYVALPDADLDYSGRAEARLLRSATATSAIGLREVWSSAHWRLFAVRSPTPLAQPPARLERLAGDSFWLRVPHPGSYLVRIRFSPYWALTRGRGCVTRAGAEDWTRVQARSAGEVEVAIEFALGRVGAEGPRCD